MEGPLYEAKCTLRRMVRRRVRFCTANAERGRIRRREKLFVEKNRSRFNHHRSSVECSKLLVDGVLPTDTEILLPEWLRHFESLAKSRSDDIPDLSVFQKKMDLLEGLSMGNEE